MTAKYLYQKIEKWLIQGVKEQRWRLGERLPSIRSLCQEHQVSKATVLHALHRLEVQGVLEARPKSGYFVALPPKEDRKPLTRAKVEAPQSANTSDLLHDIMRRGAAFDLVPTQQVGELPQGIIALNRSIGRSLRSQRGDDYQYYDEPAGDQSLRNQLSLHYYRRGWQASIEELCITSGCQHALFLALMACCKRGDVVAVESPGFYGVLQLLEQLELQVVEVPTSTETGMDVAALTDVLNRWEIKACILSPAFATPSGSLMPTEAKHEILKLADQYDLALIEDDIYADTALDTSPDPLKSMDINARVILCSSFSKSISRDLRLGWVSGARWHERIVHLKLVTQLASSQFQQQGVAAFMENGGYAAHLRKRRHELRLRRDQLITYLNNWSCDVRISVPNGGLAVWVELPDFVDTMAAYTEGIEQGIVMTPGPLFSNSGQFKNCLRISFEHPWDKRRSAALNTLSRILLGK